jgi:hypothetical protein
VRYEAVLVKQAPFRVDVRDIEATAPVEAPDTVCGGDGQSLAAVGDASPLGDAVDPGDR